MGASVSQSVSPRQELTDKAAVRRTYSLRAAPRTVKKTGSSEPTHQNPEGELVIVLSVCNVLCTHVQLSYGFHFISARVRQCSSLLQYPPSRAFLKGVPVVLNGLLLCVLLPCDSVNHYNLVMKAGSLELSQSLKI